MVRTFDAPEALDTRFYEVRAKTVINRVPEASQVPFRWTINPYRGCSHACSYCTSGDTPILMADGKHASDGTTLRVGDWIVGTERRGRYRRYVATEVLDHWSTISRLSGHARRWHGARHERRPSLPHRPRLEARHG